VQVRASGKLGGGESQSTDVRQVAKLKRRKNKNAEAQDKSESEIYERRMKRLCHSWVEVVQRSKGGRER